MCLYRRKASVISIGFDIIRFMSLSVLKPTDIILRTPCIPLTKNQLRLNKTQDEIETLLDFVYGANNKGKDRDVRSTMTVGLSANQVGIAKRISVVDLAIGRKSYSDIFVLINPEIIWHSKTQVEHVEGCVNLPNIWGYVKRFKKIKVKALDRSGNGIMLTMQGWPAILLQHEIGHLDGELFIDKIRDPKKAHLVENKEYKAYKVNKKQWKKFIDVSDLVKS